MYEWSTTSGSWPIEQNQQPMTIKAFNPFYIPLVLCGIVFCITACAYGVMTVRGLQPEVTLPTSVSGANLMTWLDENGFAVMMWELGILAVLTFAAIGSDGFWEERHAVRQSQSMSGATRSKVDSEEVQR